MKVRLRPYQEKAVGELRVAYKERKRRAPLLVMPTGAGKTVTYASIAEGAGAKGSRIIILEHRKELIRQASMALGNMEVKHQLVAPNDKIADIRRCHIERLGWPMVDRKSHVSVASVQTLGRRLDWLIEYDPQLIIIDEAHHAVAGTWARIIEACPNAKLLGVTATPCRTDGQGLGDVFDEMILGPTMRELIEWGNLCKPRVFAPPMRADISDVHISGGDYNAKELALALDKPSVTGDAVAHYKKLASGRPAIAFCASVRHAEHVAAEFRAAGYKFEIVTGDMDDDLRDERINHLADGRLHGIVTVDVVSEGTDIPVAEVAILLRPTQSESLYLQQVGRVLRPAEGKEYGLVLDHVGNVLRHGMPDADREWSLEGRKRGRGKGEQQEVTIRVLQCPKCYLAHEPAECCPGCGHVYEVQSRSIQQRAGELQEITDAPMPKVKTGNLQDKAAMLAAGMSSAQADHLLAARAEKERLQSNLRNLIVRWSQLTGIGVREGWGFQMYDIRYMKPKALKQHTERLEAAIELATLLDGREVEGIDQRQLSGLGADDIRKLINKAGEGLFMLPANNNRPSLQLA